jgi:ankyrin repeat protein
MNFRNTLEAALQADDVAAAEAVVREHPELLNPEKQRPPVTQARSVAMAELLLKLGAGVKAAGKWWAPGFYTRSVAADVGRLLVERGAALTPHAAAGLGMVDRLREILAADPTVVHAKGGDGCTPLHFSRDIATATLLLEHGAIVDARDEDHESTPAQWLIGDAPEVSRFLLDRGAAADIFLAAALGDRELAERLISADRGCLSHRIGKAPEFPPLGYKQRGGTIYQWTLAFNSYSHQIALRKGHEALFEFLYENSDTATQLLVSCVLARRGEAEAIAAENPGLVAALPDVDKELVAKYCWETNTNFDAVKLMLDLGFPVAHPERSHGYSPLHNAAWAGSGDLVALLIERGAPVDLVDPRYEVTPLGFAIYDCVVEKRHPEGEFARVTKALLDAGSPWEALEFPFGDERIDDVMRPRLRGRVDGAAMLGDEDAVFGLLGAHPAAERLSEALAGAAKGGHVSLLRRLIELGAPVDAAVGQDRDTALMYAAMGKSRDAIALLLEHGADAGAKNAQESTALHMAIWRGAELPAIELLLRAAGSALIEAKNKFGYSPLSIAIEKGREDAAQLLRGFHSASP